VSSLPILLPVGLIVFAILAGAAGLWAQHLARSIAVVGTGLAAAAAAVGLVHVSANGPVSHHLGGWAPPIGIEYVLDPLSGFMAVLVTFIGFLAVVYAPRAGLGAVPGRGAPVHSLILILLAGLLGVIMSGDLFNLYVFLEVYAIATYGLVALGGPRATFASFRYLLLGSIASGFYLLGVGFVYFMTGSLNMVDVAERLAPVSGSTTIVAAAVLIVVGLGLKMALFPLHVWLPEAHSYAPPAVAALLAAIQVKAAAYALIRILFGVFGEDLVVDTLPLMTLLAWFGAAAVVFGSIAAIRQSDFKRMLAFSTVAQLGYIGLGIGLANPIALVGALLHVLAHAFAKCCLFFVAGGVIDATGIKQVSRFAGLGRRMPWTMAGFAVAALSMVGIPPTVGFVSKFYLVWGSVDAGQWVLAVVIVVSSLLTLAYFLRVFERIWMSDEIDEAAVAATEPGRAILGPVVVLAVGLLVAGLANVAITRGVLDLVATSLLGAP
jgi:multicomponent Na+:H+ antiporter subunit D